MNHPHADFLLDRVAHDDVVSVTMIVRARPIDCEHMYEACLGYAVEYEASSVEALIRALPRPVG